jgi:hypothetical protein
MGGKKEQNKRKGRMKEILNPVLMCQAVFL